MNELEEAQQNLDTFNRLIEQRDHYRDRLIEAEKIMKKIADFCEVMVDDGHVTDIDEMENFVTLFKFLKLEKAVDKTKEKIFEQSTGL